MFLQWLRGVSSLGNVQQGPGAPAAKAVPASTPPVSRTAAGYGALGIAADTFARTATSADQVPVRPAGTVAPASLPPTAVKNAIVVGAGPAGLMAAMELLQNGANVTIVEQRDAYSRPIHFNVRGELLHHLAEKCPHLVDKILAKMGTIERAEIIDGTVTSLTDSQLADLRAAEPNREFTLTPYGLKIGQQPLGLPKPDATLATFGGRVMMESPSVGQIAVTELEEILYEELERMSKEPTTGSAPTVTILRDHRPEYVKDAEGNYRVSVTRVRAEIQADGRPKWVAAGAKMNLPPADLVVVAEGANSETRNGALGVEKIERTFVSPGAVFIAGSIKGGAKTDKAPNGGLIRRRYAEMKDPATGEIHGIRQIIVGHAKLDRTWLLVEVPPFIKLEGKAAVEAYYREHAGYVSEMTPEQMATREIIWGPNPFVMQQFISKTAVQGNNLILIGDAVGNAHFLTSGGMNTACVPHSFALQTLLENLRAGVDRKEALKRYDLRAIAGTKEWLRVGYAEFGRQIAAANFGQAFSEAFREARKRLGLEVAEKETSATGEHVQGEVAEETNPLSGNGTWKKSDN